MEQMPAQSSTIRVRRGPGRPRKEPRVLVGLSIPESLYSQMSAQCGLGENVQSYILRVLRGAK